MQTFELMNKGEFIATGLKRYSAGLTVYHLYLIRRLRSKDIFLKVK